MVTATPEEMANWPIPNYVNPETRVNLALGWIISTMTLMLIFLAARLYSRAILKAALGADDWVMAAAAVRCSDHSLDYWVSCFEVQILDRLNPHYNLCGKIFTFQCI